MLPARALSLAFGVLRLSDRRGSRPRRVGRIRRVALKLLLAPEISSEASLKDATARMIREARAAAALDHPNKVSVFEFGEFDGTPYLAMELITGPTLRAKVGDRSIVWQDVIAWLVDTARALDAAHAAGLLHRDIKPHEPGNAPSTKQLTPAAITIAKPLR